jgi:hypothetical protein
MATAGFLGLIYEDGTSTAMTAEACSLVSGKTYRITDAAKRMLDPAVAVVVDDNGSPVSAGDIESIDYMHGLVVFDSGYTVTGPVTIDANYLPLSFIGDVYEMSASLGRTVLDTTAFTSTQDDNKTCKLGLKDISGSFSARDNVATALASRMAAGTVLYLTMGFSGSMSSEHLRARVLLTGIEPSVSVDGIVENTYSFQGAAVKSVEGRDVCFSLAY